MEADDDSKGFSGPLYEMEVLSSSGEKNPLAASTRTSTTPFDLSTPPANRNASPQEGVTVQELAPVDRGIQAWTFCASAFVLETLVWGYSYSYGIFQDYYTSHPPFSKESPVAIAAVGTVCLALESGLCFFLFFILQKYPDYVRMSMWGGLVVCYLSLFASSFATQVWQLILLQGVGVGIGGGVMYMPIIYFLPQWFSERRGLAGGIIFSGAGVGGFVFPFILNALLNKVGLAWTLRIWAIVGALCSGLALLGVKARLPVPKYTAINRRPRLIPNDLSFFRTPLFLTFAITNVLQGLAYFPVSLYIAMFARALSNEFTASIVLSLFNASASIGQIVTGHLTDRIPYPTLMAVSAVVSGIGAFVLWGLADATINLYLFAVVFGSLSGGFTSTWTNAAYECSGSSPEYAGIVFYGMSLARSVSVIVGPVASGLLLEAGAGASSFGGRFGRFGYGAVEVFVGSCALATGASSVAVAFARRRITATPVA